MSYSYASTKQACILEFTAVIFFVYFLDLFLSTKTLTAMRNYIKLISLSKNTLNHCYLLQIDNTKLLFNLGAFNLDFDYLYEQKDVILGCDAIFISHFDLNFCGGLPFLKKINYSGTVYATIPVCVLSRISIKEYNNDRFLVDLKRISSKENDHEENTNEIKESNDELITNKETKKGEGLAQQSENTDGDILKNKYCSATGENDETVKKRKIETSSVKNNLQVQQNSETVLSNQSAVVRDTDKLEKINELQNTEDTMDRSKVQVKEEISDRVEQKNTEETMKRSCLQNTEEIMYRSKVQNNGEMSDRVEQQNTEETMERLELQKTEIMEILEQQRTGYYKYSCTEMESVFGNIVQLKHSQPIEITSNIVVAAYRSGNSLGGSIWKISVGGDNILVCLDVNQRKEMHLDGLDTEILNNVSICLFNVYCKYETIKKIDKEKLFCNYVKKYNKILIVVKFTRFLEVCCFLNDVVKNLKIKVLSNCAEEFIENAKSMVEWAGSNITKGLNENKNVPFSFNNLIFDTKISQEDKVIIVIDQFDLNSFYRQALDVLGSCDSNLIVLDEDFTQKIVDNVKIPKMVSMTEEEITLIESIKRIENKNKAEEEAIDKYLANKEDDSDEALFFEDKTKAKKMFWYEYKTDFYIENEEDMKYATFPVEKPVKFDEYGEVFYYQKPETNNDINNETTDKNETLEEVKYEKIEWENKKINPVCEKTCLDFNGICEFRSIKNILEIMKPKKLIFTGKSDATDFYYKFFGMNSNFDDVYVLKDEINLSYDVNVTQLNVNNDFEKNIRMKKLKNMSLSSFKCKINDELELSIIENGSSAVLGTLNIDEVKTLLIEKGFKTEKENDYLCIENDTSIIFKDNTVYLEGEYNDVFLSVKSLLYQNIAFLNQ